ncbi:putative transmembrane protein [Toxoplasma gondii RUB]|uniref:Putative transmembrane protein n=1 Tax=Toxoplasma gondii RUB TaxID=935652 RepID=A0A086LYK6_TOXGO|nr:putative transmembrane protein [Toxoplasma gondii RUB]
MSLRRLERVAFSLPVPRSETAPSRRLLLPSRRALCACSASAAPPALKYLSCISHALSLLFFSPFVSCSPLFSLHLAVFVDPFPVKPPAPLDTEVAKREDECGDRRGSEALERDDAGGREE